MQDRVQDKILPISIAQEAEIQDLIAAFRKKDPAGTAVAELEVLIRAAIFKPANELVGFLLQQAVDRIDEAYIPKPGEQRKGREPLMAQGMFGSFPLLRHDGVERIIKQARKEALERGKVQEVDGGFNAGFAARCRTIF